MIDQDILAWLGETPPDCILILVLGTVWFILYYIIQFRKWGVLSLGTWIVGFDFFLKTIFMYLFARSPENIVSVSSHYGAILGDMDRALRISALGILSMLIGALVVAPAMPSRRLPLLLDRVHRVLQNGWCTRRGIIVVLSLATGLTLVLVALGFRPFVARSLAYDQPELRPIYVLWSDLLPIFAMAATAYGLSIGSRLMIGTGVAIALVGGLSGDRTVVILTLAQLWIMAAMPARSRNLILPAVGGIGLLVFAVALDALRSADGPGAPNAGFLSDVFYGNNLSDLRDFAWVLSGLFDERFHGLTYLAGYFSFVPSFLSDFRTEMAIGRVTAMLAGLDPTKHAGMRLPMFGETYLNFDWPGVVLAGIVFGFGLRTILDWVETTIASQAGARRGAGAVAVWLGLMAYTMLSSIFFTPGFPGVYTVGTLLAAGFILERLERRHRPNSESPVPSA
jgi:hypothetical protein